MTKPQKFSMSRAQGFYQVWFSNGTERTAKLIVHTSQFPIGTAPTKYSHLFPYTEAPKMKRMIISTVYDTWDAAFNAA